MTINLSRPPLTRENTDSVSDVELERATWNEALHPRQGGKFAKKGTATQRDTSGSAGLSYNGRTGAGYGHKGGDNRVHALQSELNRLGLTDAQGHPLKLDGKLGPRTTAAIKKAQRALGMKPTGVATPALLLKLRQTKGLKVKRPTPGAARPSAPHRTHRTHRPAKKAAPKKTMAPARPTNKYQKAGY